MIHCNTEVSARSLWAAFAGRLEPLGVEPHPDKTKIAFCKDGRHRRSFEHTSFDFLGYTFRARLAKDRRGLFVNFSLAMSDKAKKAIGKKIRGWHLNRRSGTNLSGLAHRIDA